MTPQPNVRQFPSDMPDKPLPSSADAERMIVGTILAENGAISQVADRLTTEDFHGLLHRRVYSAMLELFEDKKPIDPILIGEVMKREGTLESIGGVTVITNLMFGLPYCRDLTEHIEIVRKTRQVRDLIKAAQSIVADAWTADENYDDILKNAQTQINEVCTLDEQQRVMSVGQVVSGEVEKIKKLRNGEISSTGIRCGFTHLDHLTNGFQPTDLIVFGGRPGMGKTMFAGQLASNACGIDPEAVIVVFSHEMSKEQLAMRFLSSEASVDQQKLKNGAINEMELFRVETAETRFNGFKIFVDDTSTLNANQMKAKLMRIRHQQKNRLDLVIVDYLQRMSPNRKTENRQQEVSAISRELKSLAKELRVPVIALASLSRACETRTDKRPLLSDLRESGDIESEADLVAFLYRDSYYNETAHATECELILAKHRNGPCETVRLNFQREFTRFSNYVERY